MSTFGSSVINKSGKKFAPKVPSRRPAAASSAQSSARASVERQALSQTPQPPINKPPLAGPPTSPVPAAADTHPIPTPEVTSDVSVSKDSTTLIPVPSRRAQEARADYLQLQSQDSQHPRVEQAPTQKAQIDLHQPLEELQQPQAASQNGTVHAEEVFAVSNNGQSGGLGTTDQDAAPVTESSVRPRSQIQSQRQEEDLHSEPAAKRRRINLDSHHRPPANNGEAVSESSNPIPTTETSNNATQDAESDLPPSQPVIKIKKKRNTKAKGKQRMEDAADAIVADATAPSKKRKGGGRPGRRRQPTPEDAETVRITPSLVKMADLCKDLRTGKKSKREAELQGMDQKEIARKEEERRILREGGQLPTPTPADDVPDRLAETEAQTPQHGHLVPQTRIRNGIIEVDPDSLVLDRHAHAAQNAVEVEIREENTLTRRITSGTWMKREKNESWNEEFTDRFYQGLRMFGTDFEMISKLFPGRTRRSIKLKFCKEEKLDKDKIKETLLGPREPVDMVKFSEMTNTEYKDPKEFERELQEDRRNLEEQQAREREAHDELVRQKDAEVAAESAAAGGGSSAKENEAQGVDSGAPTKGKRGRKASGKMKPGRAKKVVGGAVEVLGSIE